MNKFNSDGVSDSTRVVDYMAPLELSSVKYVGFKFIFAEDLWVKSCSEMEIFGNRVARLRDCDDRYQ